MHVLDACFSSPRIIFKTFMYFEVLAYVFPSLFLIYRPPWSLWLFRLDRQIRLDLINVLFAGVSFPIFCWSSGVSVPILYPVYSLYSLDRLRLSRILPTRMLAQTTLTESSLYISRHLQPFIHRYATQSSTTIRYRFARPSGSLDVRTPNNASGNGFPSVSTRSISCPHGRFSWSIVKLAKKLASAAAVTTDSITLSPITYPPNQESSNYARETSP